MEGSWTRRGYIPHFDNEGVTQFVTIRLADALPEHVVDEWKRELSSIPSTQMNDQLRRRTERYLDNGYGSCFLRQFKVANMVEQALRHFDNIRYRLHAWVIMPNHLHGLLSSLSGWRLSEIMKRFKGFTASRANGIIGRWVGKIVFC